MMFLKIKFDKFLNSNRGVSRKIFFREISIILLIAFLNLSIGCSYYKVNHQKHILVEDNPELYEMIKSNAKYVVIHMGNKSFHLKDVVVNTFKQELSGISEPVSMDHSYYSSQTKYNRRIHKHHGNPTYEIHINVSKYQELEESKVIIPISDIQKIDVYDRDDAKTILSVIGILVCVFVLIVVIIALTKSSCPFVYANKGANTIFAGEMYGGAIYSPLERDDYMPIPGMIQDSGKYRIAISNELLERQYTNLAELMVINHPVNTSVLVDKQGNLQTISSPDQPTKAIAENNSDFRNAVLSRDSNSYMFSEESIKEKSISSLELTFKNSNHSNSGKLILNAKNSYWLDYAFGKFTEQFGTYYNTFAEKQKKVSAKKNIQWSLEQGLPLSVFLETEKGWEFVDYFNLIGPIASRDIVMPIDLSKCKSEDVRIKLECGFMFWEIDYAAMDFSKNLPAEIHHLAPSVAFDENGNDVASLLTSPDDKYLIQPEPGNKVNIEYPANAPGKDQIQTVILHSKGYYEYIRDFKNKPDFLYLTSFRKKNSFTRFSKFHYDEFIHNNDILAHSLN